MNKDQALGSIIFLSCLVVAVGYICIVAAPVAVKNILPWLPWSVSEIQFGAVATVVLLAFLAIMTIGAWIGWTMATTPPPKPIEELEPENSESNLQEKERK